MPSFSHKYRLLNAVVVAAWTDTQRQARVDARADEGWVGRASGRVVFEGLALIQVQWQWRRLYDDEEHLGDREACNFARSTRRTCTAAAPCTPTFHACTDLSSSAILRHSTSRTTTPPRGSKGPICIRTWNRGDASSIISLGISHRLRASINSPSSPSYPLSLSPLSHPLFDQDRFPFENATTTTTTASRVRDHP